MVLINKFMLLFNHSETIKTIIIREITRERLLARAFKIVTGQRKCEAVDSSGDSESLQSQGAKKDSRRLARRPYAIFTHLR